MNKITLSHHTALWCIREIRENPKNTQLINIANQKLLTTKLRNSPQMHILVLNQNDKHCNLSFKFHLQTKPLPRNSINKITENISIVCPELMLIQLARTLPYEQLFLVALELCGTYTLCTQNGNFASGIPAITTPEKLRDYLNKYKRLNYNVCGIDKLNAICNLVEANSASPMESRLFIKLCGGRKYGLYECKNLKFNECVPLSSSARKIAGQDFVIPDLSSQKHKVAIEYNSAQFHEELIQGQKDHRRRDALVHDG